MSCSTKSTLTIWTMAAVGVFLILQFARGFDAAPFNGQKKSSPSVILSGSLPEASSGPVFVQHPSNTYITEKSWGLLNCSAKFAASLEFICIPQQFLKEYIGQVSHILQHNNSTGLTSASLGVSYEQIANLGRTFLQCQCQASGQNGSSATSDSAKIMLTKNNFVLPGTLSPEDGLYHQRLKRGKKLKLDCAPPRGFPAYLDISWKKDNKTISSTDDGRVQIRRNTANVSLIITKTELEDTGFYHCEARNTAGVRKSYEVHLQVFVDGGWSEWRPWEPDKGCALGDEHLLCGNGTQTLIRYCNNPRPTNGGSWCVGQHRWIKASCSKPCPDGELPRISCPHSGLYHFNASDHGIIKWGPPAVKSRYNYTLSMTVDPPDVHPPLFPVLAEPYRVTYTAVTSNKAVVSCSFNVTVHNFTTCPDPNNCAPGEAVQCKNGEGDCSPTTPGSVPDDGFNVTPVIIVGITIMAVLLVLLAAGSFVARLHQHGHYMTEEKGAHTLRRLIDEESGTYSSVILKKGPLPYTPVEKLEQSRRKLDRQVSDASLLSTASAMSRMFWNISNLPSKADHRNSAWGLLDHTGGLLTIAESGINLLVPPFAIPKGRTEAVFIALMKEDGEYPLLSERQSLLSPVVVCGPNGLKFDKPVMLTMPQCATFLEDNAWDIHVYYNESGADEQADWKQLVEVNTDEPSQSSFVLTEQKSCHLMVDHFTDFVLVGESAPGKQAVRNVKILAYFNPPKKNTDCVVRVYCVADTPAALKNLHDQEKERFDGETIDAPKPFNFRDGGRNLKVDLLDYQEGWQAATGKHKEIRFLHIWNGIERMPSCTFVFNQMMPNEVRFHCSFEVQQDCADSDVQEVIVATGVQREPKEGTMHDSTLPPFMVMGAQSEGASGGVATDGPTASYDPFCRSRSTSSVTDSGNHYPPHPMTGPSHRPADHRHWSCSSGYSSGLESLESAFDLPQQTRNELILLLDPPRDMDWRVLAEKLGYKMKHITWLDSRRDSPTETLLNCWEAYKKHTFPPHRLMEILRDMGRDDAADEIEKILPRETRV